MKVHSFIHPIKAQVQYVNLESGILFMESGGCSPQETYPLKTFD